MSKASFLIKQYIKMFVQNIYLPAVYKKEVRRTEVDKNIVIFADMHSDELPFSMRDMYKRMKAENKKILVYCKDIAKLTNREKLGFMKSFMKAYAAAGYVYICSYFLPVSSCDKREETKVIQLWHSGGLLKTMGYDTHDDIPEIYKGNVTKNYSLVTVSSDICIGVWEKALRLPKGITKATGLARTDIYFDDEWNDQRRELFFRLYPDAKGKKVVLYAPSFSGNAADPSCEGLEKLKEVFSRINENYFLIIRLHPNLKSKYPEYWNEKVRQLPTEALLPSVNLLITDYSSVLFDYSLYRRPFVLFCPDIDKYKEKRGFYSDPESFPAPFVKDENELERVLTEKTYFEYSEQDYEEFYEKYMGSCRGNSIDNILTEVGYLK